MAEENSFDGLRRFIKEENALSSIDLVYFLLVPITLFFLSELTHIDLQKDLGLAVISIAVLVGGLLSLPFGIYAKMKDSMKQRIVAWGLFIYFALVYGAMLASSALNLLLSPPESTSAWVSLRSTFVLSGSAFMAIGLGSVCIEWVFAVFAARLPSRKEEILRAREESFFVKYVLYPLFRSDQLIFALTGAVFVGVGLVIRFVFMA
jgi:hypothetical protein